MTRKKGINFANRVITQVRQRSISVTPFGSHNNKRQTFSEDPDNELNTHPDIKSPERNLIAGMLTRAILDLEGSGVEIQWRRSAEKWIFCYPNDYREFSFNWCCQELDLDPQEIVTSLKNQGRTLCSLKSSLTSNKHYRG